MQAPPLRPVSPAAPALRQAASQPVLHHIGLATFLALLFVTFSRLAETIAVQLGANLRIALVLIALSFGSALLLGRVMERSMNRMGVVLAALTVWFFVCVPASVHKGGSFRHLTSYWLSTLLTSLCVLYFADDAKSLRRMLYAIVAGTLLVAFARAGDTGFSIGALGNANLYGQHLLYGIPFILLPLYRHGFLSVRGALAVASVGILVAKVVGTGSRSSLIATAVVLCILFLQMPFLKKLAILLLAIPAAVLFVATIPPEAMLRYSTIFNDNTDRVMTLEELSAIESTKARKHHFQQSVELTFSNPVLGIGPGMFAVAAAEDSAEKGERALWKETHNSYTQISSESGLPGLILYLGMIVFTIGSALKTVRLARYSQPGSEMFEYRQIAMALLVSLLAMSITGMFSSSAYLPYFPLLGCFAVATAQLAEREAVARQAAPAPVAAAPVRPRNPFQRPLPSAGPAFRA